MPRLSIAYFLLLLPLAAPLAAAEPAAPAALKSPLSPEDSLRHFVLPPGLKAEIVAAEPEIVDPVAMRFDQQGRLWVVEMRDYPDPPAEGELPKSRIKLLEDLDGDGRYETAHTFAEHLLFATGIQPWRNGVLATVSGRILYLEDTDGDNKADRIEPWFSGFVEKNPQLRVNHPRFALDNHIYVAAGLSGGEVQNERQPKSPVIRLAGHDWRFDPRTEQGEPASGNGQFGMTFDDYAHRFLCSNRRPLMHVVLEDRYLAHNPLLAVPAVVYDVAAEGDHSHVYPLSQAWTTSHLHAGQFTAACGTDIYRGTALPEEYRGNSFTCEPTGNLVHRELVTSSGGTFSGQPAYEGKEFLATRDGWCRPVAIESGPDGALYVVDMYRAVIEHPQFMPDELKKRPDLRWGDDRGRIYRIVPVDHRPWQRPARLDQLATAELLAPLSHANSWQRETAARLIYERQDKSIAPQLAKLAREAIAPQTRVHALWALVGLESMTDDLRAAALADEHPRVREQAVVLAESRIKDSPLRGAVLKLSDDADARVRFQVALSLGMAPGDNCIGPLASIARAGADDLWTRRAVETAASGRAAAILRAVILSAKGPPAAGDEGGLSLAEELARLVGLGRQDAELAIVFDLLSPASSASADRWQLALLDGLAEGLRSRGVVLSDLAKGTSEQERARRVTLDGWFAQAAGVAVDPKASTEMRVQGIRLLAFASHDTAAPVLTKALNDENQQLRLAAVAALAASRDPGVAKLFVERLAGQTSTVRAAILDALLSQPARSAVLLDELAAGRIKPSELDPLRVGRLVSSRDPAIRDRAKKLLAADAPADRQKALADYQPTLKLTGDARAGKEVFRKNCATCHRIDDVGVDVGPAIGDARTKTPEQLLLDILLPSKAIDNNFLAYSVATDDGNTYTGLIAAETPVSLTMKLPEGKTVPILRRNIEELRSTGVSLMPEGLERNIPPQAMADVIAFIKGWRYLNGQVPVGPGG